MEKHTNNFIIQNASKVFFTSDTHFTHENIIKFCHRPFQNAEEMNEVLIHKWNETVPEDGTVYHLGDFAWGQYDAWKNIIDKLHGQIILVKGNHDFKNGKRTESLFEDTCLQRNLVIEGRQVILNHYPFLCYGGTYRSSKNVVYQLFGHVHTSDDMNGYDKNRLSQLFPSQYDVGVDNNDFKPISWHEVNEIIQKQIENYDSNNS